MCQAGNGQKYKWLEYKLSEMVPTLLRGVIQDTSFLPRFAFRQLLHAWTIEELPFEFIFENRLTEQLGRFFFAEPGTKQSHFFLAVQFFVRDWIAEMCWLASEWRAN